MPRGCVLLFTASLLLTGCQGPPADRSAGATGDSASGSSTSGDPTSEAVDPRSGKAAMGQFVFNRCVACHTADKGGAHGVGPNLHGVVGRQPGQAAGYAFSPAMMAKGGIWDAQALDRYLTDPHRVVPGTKMAFAGVPDARDRANLIAWLSTQAD